MVTCIAGFLLDACCELTGLLTISTCSMILLFDGSIFSGEITVFSVADFSLVVDANRDLNKFRQGYNNLNLGKDIVFSSPKENIKNNVGENILKSSLPNSESNKALRKCFQLQQLQPFHKIAEPSADINDPKSVLPNRRSETSHRDEFPAEIPPRSFPSAKINKSDIKSNGCRRTDANMLRYLSATEYLDNYDRPDANILRYLSATE